jgi:uncharacterized protein (DUF3084 family)
VQRNSEQVMKDREQATKDRDQAMKDREQAIRDRAQAIKDREQATKDRKQAMKDREQAMKDRGQMEKIIGELINENIIKNKKELYSLHLNVTQLEVNGVIQPAAIHKKFKDKYVTDSLTWVYETR